jgi:hypothetical protein
MKARRLKDSFAVLRPDQHVDSITVTPNLYAELDVNFGGFAGHHLVAWHEFETDWNTWECHPAGEGTENLEQPPPATQ